MQFRSSMFDRIRMRLATEPSLCSSRHVDVYRFIQGSSVKLHSASISVNPNANCICMENIVHILVCGLSMVVFREENLWISEVPFRGIGQKLGYGSGSNFQCIWCEERWLLPVVVPFILCHQVFFSLFNLSAHDVKFRIYILWLGV